MSDCHWVSPAPCVYEWLGEEGCGQHAGATADGRNLGTIPTVKMSELGPILPWGLGSGLGGSLQLG